MIGTTTNKQNPRNLPCWKADMKPLEKLHTK